jgi:predicted amidohydrolase YtcJ
VIDGEGNKVSPGFLDTHMHIAFLYLDYTLDVPSLIGGAKLF